MAGKRRPKTPHEPATWHVDDTGTLIVRVKDRLPPSPNARLNPTVLWVKRKEAKESLADDLVGIPRVFDPLVEAEVQIVFFVPDTRERDYDNALSAVKPWVDALVVAGALVDDSNRVIRSLAFGFVHAPGMRWTEFRVRPYSARNDLAELRTRIERLTASEQEQVMNWITAPRPAAGQLSFELPGPVPVGQSSP